MPRENENLPIVDLIQLDEELEESIARCRRLLSDCKSKLAANDENGSGPANDLGPSVFVAATPSPKPE